MVPETLAETAEPNIEIINTPLQDTNQDNSTTIQDDFDKRVLDAKKSGKSIRELASLFQVNKGRIERSLNRSLKQFARDTGMGLSVSREDILQKIFNLAPKSLDKVSSLMEGAEKQEVQLKAATDLLDRAGFSPVQKTLNITLIEEMSRAELVAGIRAMLASPDISPVINPSPTQAPTQPTP